MHRFARESWQLGIRYIGGCCGFEPYHIRAVAEELAAERGGRLPPGSEKHDMWGGGLRMHTKPWVRARYVHGMPNSRFKVSGLVVRYAFQCD